MQLKNITKCVVAVSFAAMALTGCRHGNGSTTIDGTVEGLKGDSTMYLYGIDGSHNTIDTIRMTSNQFSRKVNIDTLALMMLRVDDEHSYPIIADRGDKLNVEVSVAKGKEHFSLTGNALGEELTRMLSVLADRDSLKLKPTKQRVEEYMSANPTSLVSAYLLCDYTRRNRPEPEDVELMMKKLSGVILDTPLLTTLSEELQMAKRCKTGSFVPLFSMTNDKGETITRSNTFNNKYLLITFWSTWDDGCTGLSASLRKLNKEMKKHADDFGMLSVALDADKAAWKRRIEKDTLTWTQTCETAMFNSNNAEQFGVTTLPLNILVAPTGRIIERGIPTDSVASRVETELKKKAEREKAEKEFKAKNKKK
jgi:hypothetical protein